MTAILALMEAPVIVVGLVLARLGGEGAEARAFQPSCPRRESGSKACCRRVVAAPTFAIRNPAVAFFTLEDYVRAGIMSAGRADVLRQAVASRVNILMTGSTSTRKTTLTKYQMPISPR